MMKKYPAIISAMEKRHEIYKAQIDEIKRQEEKKEVLVIRPPKPLGIGRTEKNSKKLECVYQVGRNEAKKNIKEIKEFLSK